MGNSQSEGEKALDNTLAAQAGQMRPTTEQITELWDAYDKNKDGILVSVARGRLWGRSSVGPGLPGHPEA